MFQRHGRSTHVIKVCSPPPPRTLQSMYARIDPALRGDHKFTFIPEQTLVHRQRNQQSQPLSIKPWSSTEPELPLNNTWLAFPYTLPHWDPEERVRVQTSLLIFKRLPFILAAARFSDTAQTWKYQEGKAVGGWCHLFRHMFVLVLKDSLIRRPFRNIVETKTRMDNFADGSFRTAHVVRLYSFIPFFFF